MATNPTPTPEEQRHLVYQVICAISAHCDGAQSLDMQGFNGVDTKFGKRIAAVSEDEWTPEVHDEAAHIVLKYREQGIRWTGIDVATLPSVLAAQDWGTNYAARDQARTYEKAAAAKANRKVDVIDGKLAVAWGRDPEFSELLAAVKEIPGRDWDGYRKVNFVEASDELDTFIDTFDFTVTDAARAALEAPRKAPEKVYEVTLEGQRIRITSNVTGPWNAEGFQGVKLLPGRAYDPATKTNTVDVHPDVVRYAEKFGLSIHPDVFTAIGGVQQALQAQHAADLAKADMETVMGVVSRTGKPEDLPPVFIEMLRGVLG